MKPEPSLTTLKPKLAHAFAFAQTQVEALITRHPDYFPLYTEGGKWQHTGEAWTNWCEGFLGGMMWLFYQRDGDPLWREPAEHYSLLLEARQFDRNVHDLGFVFWSTWKRWYDLTGDPALNEVIIQAGKTMGMRFKEKGQRLRSFVSEDSLFIDIMMNVGIVFYAAQQSGDADLLRKAHAHCMTTRRTIVRGDGSTSHEGLFDRRRANSCARPRTRVGEAIPPGAGTGLGAVWFRHGLRSHWRAQVFADRGRCAPISTSKTPPRRRRPLRAGRAAQRLG